MEQRYDLVIGNARLRGQGRTLHQIGLRDGAIATISADPLSGEVELDAGGNLVSESFVDAHLHLCKVDTLAMAGEEALAAYTGGQMGEAAAAIDLASAVKDRYDEAWIEPNARRALLDGLRHGVTHVRAFADTDTRARLEGVRPLLRLRDELADVLTVQVVAFPQDGVVRDPGAEDYVREALEAGADLVGGIPWIEASEADMRAHIDTMLALAVEFDRDVAMLTDDVGDPSLRTTELLASAALDVGWAGRVSACHARAMALYPEEDFRRLVDVARSARMTFVTDPHTGPLHLRATDLLAAGLAVALGQDDIADAYYPYGQHNLLEVAFIASHVLGLRDAAGMETLLDMVTVHPAHVLGLPDHRLAEGSPANLVVLDGADAREVLARHAAPRHVVSRGRLVAETVSTTTYYGDPGFTR